MIKKYQIIYADPPWRQRMSGFKKVRPNSSGKGFIYPVLSLQEIQQHLFNATLETSSDSILFLWTIEKYLFEAERIAIKNTPNHFPYSGKYFIFEDIWLEE